MFLFVLSEYLSNKYLKYKDSEDLLWTEIYNLNTITFVIKYKSSIYFLFSVIFHHEYFICKGIICV